MQERKNKYFAVSLAVLVMTSLSLFFFTREEVRSEINRDEFKLTDSEKIDHLTLSSSGQKLELKFENNRWRVNDRWDADTRMITVLFATLRQVEVRRPVAATLRDSVTNWLRRKGMKVTLFEEGTRRMEFLAGGNASKTEAWFLKEGDPQPYAMIIPGYRVYVAGILELDEGGWRSKRVFDFNWMNFKSLTATYPGEPKQSIEVEMKNHIPGIKNMVRVDTTKLSDYLDAVSLLFVTRYISLGEGEIDSLVATSPVARIEIKDIASRTYALELFAPRKNEGEIFGRLADGQRVALKRSKAADIMKRRDYFIVR